MNSNKRDIYFQGRIYQQVPDGMSRYNYGSVPVDGEHPFENMQDVTGMYELGFDGPTCHAQQVAIPLPTPAPVAELPKEAEGKDYELKAKELMEKFYEVLLVDGSLNEKRICWGYAKQCALIGQSRVIEVLEEIGWPTLWSEIQKQKGVLEAIKNM